MAETLPEGPGIYVVGGRRYQLPGPPDAGTVAKLEAHAQQQAASQGSSMLGQVATAIPFAGPIMEQLSKHPDAMSTAAQVGAPLALAAGRMMPGGTLAKAAVGALPALASYAASNYLNRKPGEGAGAAMPTLGQAGQVAAGEGMGALANAASSKLLRPAAEALKGSQLGQLFGAKFGSLTDAMRPTARAGEIIKRMRGVITQADDATRASLTHSLESHGIAIHKLDAESLMEMVRTEPEKLAAAAQSVRNAGSELLTPTELRRLWVDDAIFSGAKSVSRNFAANRALYEDAGERKILNAPLIADRWRALSADGRAAFGPSAKAMDSLVGMIDKLKKAPIGIQRIVGAEKGQIPMDPFISVYEKIAKAYGQSPLKTIGKLAAKTAGLGAMGMEAMVNPHLAGAAGAAYLGAKGAAKLSKRAAFALTQKMLTTDGGIKLLTDGVRMMAEGHPRIVIAHALMQSAARAPDLLAAWGFESPQQAPGQ